MGDECILLRKSIVRDQYGDVTYAISGSFPMPCGFQFVGGQVMDRLGGVTTVDYDGILRIDLAQDIQLTDEVHLTRKGNKQVDLFFYIMEQPQYSVSVQKLHVKKVTTSEQ